jgi:general secretion pathway protein L
LAYAADNTLHLSCFKDEQIQLVRTLDLDADLMNQLERVYREFDFNGSKNTESEATATLNVYCHGPGASEAVLRKLNTSPNLAFSLPDLSQSQLEENHPIAGTGLALKSLQPVSVDINLLPDQFRKKPSVIARYMPFGLVLLTLITGMAWAGSHFIHQRITNLRVDRELNELSGEIKALGKAQTEITTLQERIDYLNTLRQDRINALEILKELTETLPDTAWLLALSVADNQVEIQGYADYSTQLIARLEASRLFANAKFISTITKGRDGKEVFKIGFEIRRQ